ncbi:MAG: S41 family peptidase [Bacteroidota bacterium]
MKTIIFLSFLVLSTCKLYSQSEVFMDYFIHDYFLKPEVVSDLDNMIKSIEEVHPNPYHSNSKESIYSLRDSIVSILPDTISKNRVYLAFKLLSAAYGEGHTDVLLFITRNDLDKYQESFPLWVGSFNDAGFIVEANVFDTIDIKQGDIITSINGVSESLIKKEIARYSGESETYALNGAIGFLFPLWVELLDIHAPFIITYQRNDLQKTIRMESTTATKYYSFYSHLYPNRTQPFNFSIIGNNIAYIEFTVFDYPKEFSRFLKKSFKSIKKNKCSGLIIDIRDNGGGKEDIGPMLIDYIHDKPYTVINAVDRKVSEYHKNLKKEVARIDKNKYMFIDTTSAYFQAPNGTIFGERDTSIIYPTNNNLRYKGKVCMLIGPKCFSYANSFAAEIKYNNIVELIGEPLEVNQDEYADISLFLLPETKFKLMTSTAYFLPIDQGNSEPVQPDIFVQQSIYDSQKGVDSIIECAKKWILKQ